GGQGIGFAIPADKVRRIVAELTQFGKVRPAWIGIEAKDLTPSLAQSLGWDRNYGVIVEEVEPGSPAEQAGVRRGEVLAEVAGSRVEDSEDFNARMRGYPARASVSITLFRQGATRTVSITPVQYPSKLAENLAWDRLGIRVRQGESSVVITDVRPGSSASQVGLSPGDVILRLNNQPIHSPDVFRESLVTARGSRSVLLLVRRGRFRYNIPLPF
ncbi:MAG TPA: PDZ domain-containing protein, partial [Myxococcaceae bacterium]|nr:PDZ domain-containing protein [Myxococcaceae bacterium]